MAPSIFWHMVDNLGSFKLSGLFGGVWLSLARECSSTLPTHVGRKQTMWPNSQLLDLLGIDHPIIQAPMSGSTTPALAAAVSNARGYGIVGPCHDGSDAGAAATGCELPFRPACAKHGAGVERRRHRYLMFSHYSARSGDSGRRRRRCDDCARPAWRPDCPTLWLFGQVRRWV